VLRGRSGVVGGARDAVHRMHMPSTLRALTSTRVFPFLCSGRSKEDEHEQLAVLCQCKLDIL
jgi:hypothetical protein